jgi:hypothetical protein
MNISTDQIITSDTREKLDEALARKLAGVSGSELITSDEFNSRALASQLVPGRVYHIQDADEFGFGVERLDVDNMETINRWPGSTNSWTADRTGWVVCYLREGQGLGNEMTIKLNNKILFAFTNSASIPPANFTVTIPIAKGQTISRPAGTDSVTYCYFIPLKVSVERSASVEIGEDQAEVGSLSSHTQ